MSRFLKTTIIDPEENLDEDPILENPIHFPEKEATKKSKYIVTTLRADPIILARLKLGLEKHLGISFKSGAETARECLNILYKIYEQKYPEIIIDVPDITTAKEILRNFISFQNKQNRSTFIKTLQEELFLKDSDLDN